MVESQTQPPSVAGRPSIEELASFPLFAALSAEEHERLAEMSEIVVYPGGSVVFEEGDAAGDIFLMLEGHVTLCMRVPAQPDACFLSLRVGELLGWSSMLARRRVATARVMGDSRLLRLPASALLELCELDHHVGYAIMRQAFEEMADRLQTTRLQLLDIFGPPPSKGAPATDEGPGS